MFAKWIRNLIANSLFYEVYTCTKGCEKQDGGFHNYSLCEQHKYHITLHNSLTTINEE